MLPFLKNQKEGSVSQTTDVLKRESDDGAEEYDPMHSAVEDLFAAYKSNDVKAGAEALRAAFELMESTPHQEGEHI